MPKAKTFDPDDFYHFAGSIIRDPKANEAELRSAVSRVYYSLFLIARDRLFGMDEKNLTEAIRKKITRNYRIKIDKKKKRLGTHQVVIFAIQDKLKSITLSHQLDQLREARVNADYRIDNKYIREIDKKSWREYAEENMQLAALALPRLKKLPYY